MTVEHIFIAHKRGAPMQSLAAARAVAGSGLEGDRYTRVASKHTDDYQLTLIEAEAIEDFVAATGLALRPEEPRRNVVTRGVRLNELCGKRFRIGDAVLEGVELCEPCTLFAKRTHRAVLKEMAGRGGLRARVVEGGEIRVGDALST
jgi:MOSC domain-containing protein YiiM